MAERQCLQGAASALGAALLCPKRGWLSGSQSDLDSAMPLEQHTHADVSSKAQAQPWTLAALTNTQAKENACVRQTSTHEPCESTDTTLEGDQAAIVAILIGTTPATNHKTTHYQTQTTAASHVPLYMPALYGRVPGPRIRPPTISSTTPNPQLEADSCSTNDPLTAQPSG